LRLLLLLERLRRRRRRRGAAGILVLRRPLEAPELALARRGCRRRGCACGRAGRRGISLCRMLELRVAAARTAGVLALRCRALGRHALRRLLHVQLLLRRVLLLLRLMLLMLAVMLIRRLRRLFLGGGPSK